MEGNVTPIDSLATYSVFVCHIPHLEIEEWSIKRVPTHFSQTTCHVIAAPFQHQVMKLFKTRTGKNVKHLHEQQSRSLCGRKRMEHITFAGSCLICLSSSVWAEGEKELFSHCQRLISVPTLKKLKTVSVLAGWEELVGPLTVELRWLTFTCSRLFVQQHSLFWHSYRTVVSCCFKLFHNPKYYI